MRKTIIFTLALTLISGFALFGFGCGPAEEKTGEEATSSIEDLFSRAEKINEMSYDMHVTGPDGTKVVSVLYVKGTKMRTETMIQGQQVIMLGDSEDAMYTYYPDQNTAMKIDMSDGEIEEGVEQTPIQMLEEVMDSVKIIGEEKIDNKLCTVIEYKMADQGLTQTMWLWQKYGIPIKVVTQTSQGTTTIEYRNIEFGNIPDSMFELPDGVEVMDLESMMQGNFDPSMFEGLAQ